jgi:hypothetical protein
VAGKGRIGKEWKGKTMKYPLCRLSNDGGKVWKAVIRFCAAIKKRYLSCPACLTFASENRRGMFKISVQDPFPARQSCMCSKEDSKERHQYYQSAGAFPMSGKKVLWCG